MRYFNTLLVTIVVSVGCIRGALGSVVRHGIAKYAHARLGGMAGTSIAAPQDLTSSINGNPASLTQFKGTQFLFGGAWAEPTFNMTQTSNIPIIGPPSVEPFSGRSTAPGTPAGNIGVTQDLSALGNVRDFWHGLRYNGGRVCRFSTHPQ